MPNSDIIPSTVPEENDPTDTTAPWEAECAVEAEKTAAQDFLAAVRPGSEKRLAPEIAEMGTTAVEEPEVEGSTR